MITISINKTTNITTCAKFWHTTEYLVPTSKTLKK